jgi:hypothetical protein
MTGAKAARRHRGLGGAAGEVLQQGQEPLLCPALEFGLASPAYVSLDESG